jgi:hypothetical protein
LRAWACLSASLAAIREFPASFSAASATDNVITDILSRCNVDSSDIDMSGLVTDPDGNTIKVRGYLVCERLMDALPLAS